MTRPTPACRLLAVSTCLALAAGARAQCANVADLTAGTTANSNTTELTDFFGSSLFFSGLFPATGSELWQWDPANGAHLVVDLAPGAGGTNPSGLTPATTPFGPRLFFSAWEGGRGYELYASDGTATGTGRVLEIRPGSSSSFPQKFCAANDRMFFQANDGTHGDELWVSDGTAAGTHMVLDIRPGTGHGRPDHLCALDDVVLFSAADANNDRELWVSDGTAAGTARLLDIDAGGSSSPMLLTRVGDEVFFTAYTATTGQELWKSDGTTAGTTMVKDIWPGNPGSLPIEFCACGDRVFFLAKPGPTLSGLFVSDGTAAGTVYLNVHADGTLLEGALQCSGQRVFFAGHTGSGGAQELWVSDGTLAGTQQVVDLVPGVAGSYPDEITAAGHGVFFVTGAVAGGDLWFSDGTALGTVPVCDLDPSGSYLPYDLTMCRGHLFFHAYSPAYGLEIFQVATPGASTTVLGPGGRPGFTRLRVRDNAVPVLGTSIDLVGSGPSGQFSLLLGSEILPPLPAPVVPGLIDGGTDWTGIQLGLAIQLAVYATPDTSWTFVIANDPAMEGMLFRFQMLWLDPVATTPFHLSNGLQLALGTAAPH
jgi:ELWxxDGT repeat protein